jgi:hypothetical protein
MINFLPNDPLATDQMPLRQQQARPNRPNDRAGFTFFDEVPEQQYDVGTDEFLFWQCREAALAAVENWENLNGNLSEWARTGKKLELSQNFDDPDFTGPRKLNAFYDGSGLRFFIFERADGSKIFSGISTDTVAHETGHALLDTLRPEFFSSNFPEVGAFHESFADCNALLTVLADKPTRQAVLQQSADLGQTNFVESLSEYLSDAIQRQFGNVSASKPRHALNQFQWKLPSALPAGSFQDPPELLSREGHSFSRVFTGCFYDTLRNIFTASDGGDEAALAAAVRTTGLLLLAAVKAAPHTPRFFSAVGRAMLLADQDQNNAANQDAIRSAFEGHNVLLGTSPIAPTAVLDGPAPSVLKESAKLAVATVRDIRERLRAPAGAKLSIAPHSMFGSKIAKAVYHREIRLGALDKRLKGIVALATETVLVGASGDRAAVVGAMPESNQSEDEVIAFVETLLSHDKIDLGGKRKKPAVTSEELPYGVTHVIRTKASKKILTRVRYFCRCH